MQLAVHAGRDPDGAFVDGQRFRFVLCKLHGTVELHEAGPTREAIFQKLTKREQEHDGADKGIGVLIKIARAADVRGKPLP